MTLIPSPLTSPVKLTISAASGSGSANFHSNGTAKLSITQSGTYTIDGVTHSSTANNMLFTAKADGSSGATPSFTVVLVTLSLRNGSDGGVSSDDFGVSEYISRIGSRSLGVLHSGGTAPDE